MDKARRRSRSPGAELRATGNPEGTPARKRHSAAPFLQGHKLIQHAGRGGGLQASESETLRLTDPRPPGRVTLIRPGLLLESTLWRPAFARRRWTWTQRYLQQELTLCMGSVQRPPLCPGTEQRHAAGGRAPPKRAGRSLTPAAALLKTHLQRPATRSALAWSPVTGPVAPTSPAPPGTGRAGSLGRSRTRPH